MSKSPRQMSKYTNHKGVVELMNKLQVATPGEGSHLHRSGEKGKPSSLIGINLVDYSVEPSVFVQENITPSQLRELYYESGLRRANYMFSGNGEKIFGKPDEQGYSIVRTIYINRQQAYEQNGKRIEKRYPWTIKIQNGKGIKEETKTGGACCKKGSLRIEKAATINLSDGDFFALLDEAVCYMNAWERSVTSFFVPKNEEIIKNSEC